MPTAALHACGWPAGCRTLTANRLCPEHQGNGSTQHGWDTGRRPTERVRGRKGQAMRKALFAREPLCRTCEAAGRTRLASIRDHIIPLAEGGADDETNEQPLCAECSDIKTRAEAKRGRQREAAGR